MSWCFYTRLQGLHLVSVLARDAKEALKTKTKISLLTNELKIKLKIVLCLEHCFIWLRDLDTKKIFGELSNVLEENG
jgi:hypothetical protein